MRALKFRDNICAQKCCGEKMEVMSALGFHQYLLTLFKIDLFVATLLIIFHMVPPVYIVVFLQRFHLLRDEDNGWTKGFQ